MLLKKNSFQKTGEEKKSNIIINKRRRASKNKKQSNDVSKGLQVHKRLVAGLLTVAGVRQRRALRRMPLGRFTD